ncbi:hypothetical protein MAE02_57570 [Microvirga aerophila]|uniref:Uncharacterized protein n=1 Tax=Microvirga aerophila TaxID=670291 RepID=A0A512C1G7_9HYPH|nr:hypothetical protein MAE02_57570 [Microvirga aerophila]
MGQLRLWHVEQCIGGNRLGSAGRYRRGLTLRLRDLKPKQYANFVAYFGLKPFTYLGVLPPFRGPLA